MLSTTYHPTVGLGVHCAQLWVHGSAVEHMAMHIFPLLFQFILACLMRTRARTWGMFFFCPKVEALVNRAILGINCEPVHASLMVWSASAPSDDCIKVLRCYLRGLRGCHEDCPQLMSLCFSPIHGCISHWHSFCST